ncbi:hypothetical protein [Methylobacterium sp. J-067]|uniref:hypothetical protein n=1 Tax=Methylobacterium sp. J-067 TaxID=2836648 RepID=UPI001FBA90BA|nr:hypothetical protein [Methylobacterium sp. J-067]MCJ2023119.1 hypothetical protein [Methylobacterium sp. J-067]
MRNPFRRQAETAAPTLRERAANLRASLRQIPAASAALPAPGSPEAMAAWHSACNEHSKRSAPLHEYAELMDPEGGFWTKASLGRALETGGISVAEYARLHPMASERELRLDQIGHELNTAALFALAYADEYPQKPEAQPVSAPIKGEPVAVDFGPDAHIAKLAAEFCKAYAANIKADRRHMAWRMSETEWLPYYAEAKRLMEKLEATEPKTTLGMALKCLGPIGAAGYNAPADRTEHQEDAWDRLGTQFVDAVLADTLAPLPASRQPIPNRDLCREAFAYAYDLDLSAVPLDCLLRLIDVFHREAEVLSDVSQEVRFYADANIRLQNDGGEIIEAESNRLGCLRDACVQEVARRAPKTEADRDAILVSRVHHEMLCEMKIRNMALIAEIREAWGGE